MNPRELFVLTSYRWPAQSSLMIGSEEASALLNAYSVLWHPAALQGAAGPPRLASPYDYQEPVAGHVYALPESPALMLPEDWDQRARDVGAIAFRAGTSRESTLENLREALKSSGEIPYLDAALLEVEHERAASFFSIGFGYLMVETLFDAMEHEHMLSGAEFWQDVQEAIAKLRDKDPQAYRAALQSAADRLLAAREVVYPVNIYLIDLCLLDEKTGAEAWPLAFDNSSPLNVVAAAGLVEKIGRASPGWLAGLREGIRRDLVEICGGPYVERDDALLPLESQHWNLRKGLATYQDLLGHALRVFARRRCAFHPQMPLLLKSLGLRLAVLLAFDDSTLPSYQTSVVSMSAPDGGQVDAFCRTPYQAEDPQTYLHWAHYLHKTIAQDQTATLAVLHRGSKAAAWYEDLLELSRFGPVLGRWTTLARYFEDVYGGEYVSPASADEFRSDSLCVRTAAHLEHPVSEFARHLRLRRRLDTVWTLAAFSRGLLGRNDSLRLEKSLPVLEDRLEQMEDVATELKEVESRALDVIAERLLARAGTANPGYLALNPCSFARRVAVEVDGVTGMLPRTGPIKACQVDGAKARLVLEIPAFGFAWIPRSGRADAEASRMRLADDSHVRNEFFEAEIDLSTGGLRGLRDQRTRISRIGQQLVFNPGSTMRAKQVKVTSTGPALGEVISEGALLDEQEKVLALFRQRFRAWLGRPVLEVRIEIFPEHAPQGYPWHAYYGARFAWRDERATLLHGVHGINSVTHQTRLESPDYLELRMGRERTVLLTGGLPFHQRHATRMLDVILVPEGEKNQVFDLALALDRDFPMQTALGMVTPVPIVPTSNGPPHVGAAGWLFHLDAPNLLVTSFRPAAEGNDALEARLLECSGSGTTAELRCVRPPRQAVLLDAEGRPHLEASVSGDAVSFEASAGDWVHLRVEF